MRNIYITLGVLLAAIAGMAYLYFSDLNIETSANDTSLAAASKNAALIFTFENEKSFYEILSGQELLQQTLGKQKTLQLKALKDFALMQSNVMGALDKQKIYIAILPATQETTDYLISTQVKSNADQLIGQLKNKQLISQKDNIYQVKLNDSTLCFMSQSDNLLLISNSKAPIITALNKSIKPDLKFINYIKANNRFNKNTLANLYLNFNQASNLLKSILNTKLNGQLSLFNNQNTYASLSYNFSKDKLLFNGNTDVNDNSSYYKLFEDMPEQKITITGILPEQTANYTTYSINDYTKWSENLKKATRNTDENEKISQQIATIKQNYRIDLTQLFEGYFKNQLLTFQLKSGEKFGAINLKNGDKVSQLLLDLSSEYAPEIRIFKVSGILSAFFGEPFKYFERPFYTIIDNNLVFANNASSIQFFLSSYKNNQLLINDATYSAFSDQLSNSSTICFYINHKNSASIFSRNLLSSYFKQYQSENGLKNFNSFCYQLSADNGRFITNLLLFKNQNTVDTTAIKISP